MEDVFGPSLGRVCQGQRSRSPGTNTGLLADISGSLNWFAADSHRRRVWSRAWKSLKVKVNFGGLSAVYVCKNMFAVVVAIFWINLGLPFSPWFFHLLWGQMPHVFTCTTLVSAHISCHHVSVCPSVTSRCSTETAKCRITQTMPHDSPGTFSCQKPWQNSNAGGVG